MMNINFSRNEIQVLTQLLENCIDDLRAEIRETDKFEYKEMLKNRKAVLSKLHAALISAQEEMPLAE